MQFIGRASELRTLESEFQRDGGFVVIYGRRRVGKTTLIKEFIKSKNTFYFLATEHEALCRRDCPGNREYNADPRGL